MKPDDLAIAVAALLPFLGVYALGVALRRCHDSSHLHPDQQRLVQLVGEAAPGAIELILALTIVFGGLSKVQTETTAFQLVGILASSSYLALRGGYSYQSSLRDIVDPSRRRRQQPPV
jgi:hypothetical protein